MILAGHTDTVPLTTEPNLPCRVEGEGDERIVQSIFDSLQTAFEEDRAMITAQARTIATKPDAPMVALAMDAALVRFRRLVAAELAAERERAAAKARGPGSG